MASTSMMQQPPPQQPRKIMILSWPFNSELAIRLVTALDDELAAMYPDWEELPHPGFKQGKVGGDPDPSTGESKPYTANPKPDLSAHGHKREFAHWEKEADAEAEAEIEAEAEAERNSAPVLEALDADDGTSETTKSTMTTTTTPMTQKKRLIPKMYFHVAFDVTGIPKEDILKRFQGSSQELRNDMIDDNAVGCLGLKPMPHFPHHRRQQQPSLPEDSSSTPSTPSKLPGKHYAELKRMYIAPSHRGRDKLVELVPPPFVDNDDKNANDNDHEKKPIRLADLLIAHVKEYAVHELDVDVLVLETGCRQLPAIALYERLGWTRRDDYGDYVGAGLADGGVSMCYELVLGE